MSIDPINGLQLLGNLLETIPKTLENLIVSPDPRFARNLLSFFEIFEEVEPSLLRVVSDLRAFTNEPTVGMQVHYIHRAGKRIDTFQAVLIDVLDWLKEHEDWYQAFIEVSQPKVRKALINTQPKDYYAVLAYGCEVNQEYGYEQAFDLTVGLTVLRYELQAVRSPNPKFFPKPARLQEINCQINELLERVCWASNAIREFASSNLTVEDFF